MLLTSAILLVASSSIAQERYRPPDPNLLARVSYDNSRIVVRQGDLHHVCVAVAHDGDYRIVRSLDNGQTQRLHGKIPKEEFRRLTNLLEAAELRNLSGYHGGLIRQKSESLERRSLCATDGTRTEPGIGLNMKLGVCSG